MTMFGFAVKPRENGGGSPRAATPISPNKGDIGEIDTSAPFQSVKAAVTLFGEVVSPRSSAPVSKKSKADERVLEKETQHHMLLRELDYYKDQLKHAEIAKAQASRELQRANLTLQQLTNKLETLTESKEASIKATEAAKIREKELEEQQTLRAQLGTDAWRVDLDNERESYKATTGELIASKQELSDLRRDLDIALEDKLAVFQQAEDAQHKAQMYQESETKLLKEVAELRQMLDQVNLESLQAEEEHSKLIAEKDGFLMAHNSAKEEVDREIQRLREEYVPEETLQVKLRETNEEITVLQEQLSDTRASGLLSVQTMASELENAKRELQEAVAEECSLRDSVNSIKLQLEEVKSERSESEKKALAAESTVEQMQADLSKKKAELEAAMSGSASTMLSSLQKLCAEAEEARYEAEDSKKKAELQRQEAESARIMTKEAEEKLTIALKEVEEAKAAEKVADGHVHDCPGREEDENSEDSRPVRKIRLTVEEFDAMNKKIEEFKNQADLKVATAVVQVETIKASEKGVLEKLEAILKEEEAIQSEINEALKRAEMAEAAKRVVENELQKWRQNKHK